MAAMHIEACIQASMHVAAYIEACLQASIHVAAYRGVYRRVCSVI